MVANRSVHINNTKKKTHSVISCRCALARLSLIFLWLSCNFSLFPFQISVLFSLTFACYCVNSVAMRGQKCLFNESVCKGPCPKEQPKWCAEHKNAVEIDGLYVHQHMETHVKRGNRKGNCSKKFWTLVSCENWPRNAFRSFLHLYLWFTVMSNVLIMDYFISRGTVWPFSPLLIVGVSSPWRGGQLCFALPHRACAGMESSRLQKKSCKTNLLALCGAGKDLILAVGAAPCVSPGLGRGHGWRLPSVPWVTQP